MSKKIIVISSVALVLLLGAFTIGRRAVSKPLRLSLLAQQTHDARKRHRS